MAVRFVLSWAFNRRPVLFGPFSFALFRDFKDNRVRYGSYAFSWDFKDKGGQFCSVTRFHWWPVLIGYAISVAVGFVLSWAFKRRLVLFLRSLTRFRRQRMSVLFGYEISVAFGFVLSWAFKRRLVLFICSITRLRRQRPSVLFRYEISVAAISGRFQDLSGFRLCSVMSFQKTAGFVPSLSPDISKTKAVGFVLSRDFTDGRSW